MQRRRQLMGMQKSELDTSPKIVMYNNYFTKTGSISSNNGDCVTDVYHYEPKSSAMNIYSYGLTPYTIVYKDSGQTFLDYWSINSMSEPKQSRCLNANSDSVAFSIRMNLLEDCYAYCVETGQIFFAGKNTPYYGHTNISELE